MICPNCKNKFTIDDEKYKFCPFCGTKLEKVEPDFVPLEADKIKYEDKIKAFDRIFCQVKNCFIGAKEEYDEGYFIDEDDEKDFIFECAMDLLGTGIEDGVNKMWETYRKYTRN